MAKCSVCNEDKYFASENLAISNGWKFTSTRGPGGNKYGVFCPKETPEAIAEAVTEHVDRVYEVDPDNPIEKKGRKK